MKRIPILGSVLSMFAGHAAAGEQIFIPTDPRATYHEVEFKRLPGNKVEIVTRRDGPSGTSYAKRLIDCRNQTYTYLAEGDTLEEMKANEHAPDEMGELVEGSITWYVVQYACGK